MAKRSYQHLEISIEDYSFMQTAIESCSCGGSPVTLEGETVCSGCGIVMDNPFPDFGPERRAFTQAERDSRTRTGTPLSPAIHDKGLTTVISKPTHDGMGRKIKHEDRLKMLRLKKWQIRSRVNNSEQRNLAQAFNTLDRLCEGLTISHIVREEAAVLYRRALASELVRGRSIDTIMAASLYAAIRMYEIPRTLRDLSALSTYPRKDISRCYRLIIKELGLKLPIPDPRKHISTICGAIGVSQRVQHGATDLLVRAKEKRLTAGKDPRGIAAAAIYISCLMNDEKTTQGDIADAAGVTEVTIRNRYRGLMEGLKLDKSTFGRVHQAHKL